MIESVLVFAIEIELFPARKVVLLSIKLPRELLQVILDGIITKESLIWVGVFLITTFLSKVCPIPSCERLSARISANVIFNFG